MKQKIVLFLMAAGLCALYALLGDTPRPRMEDEREARLKAAQAAQLEEQAKADRAKINAAMKAARRKHGLP
jgi:hypothetical protein